MITLAIDGMGGDHAPKIVVEGMALFARGNPDVLFLLYGDQTQLQEELSLFPELAGRVTLTPTTEVVTGDMNVSQALRGMQGDSSMHRSIKAVAQGEAHGVVSAGNTGAYMALSRMILRTIHGIDRPAIVSCLPSLRGLGVMLDLGGNLHCDACHLVDYALMGTIFAQKVLKIARPSVGLLNVGVEHSKGHEALKEAAETLRGLPINFYGFIEGNDISKGTVDVIVTDGFTGNAVLKSGEGMVHLVFQELKKAFSSSLWAKIGGMFARSALNKLKNTFDPRNYNGAIWLGLNGVAVKSHGGADALGFSKAIAYTLEMIRMEIPQLLEAYFLNYQSGQGQPPGALPLEGDQ